MNWVLKLAALASVLGTACGQCASDKVTTLDLFKSEVSNPGTADNNLQYGGRLVYRNAGKISQAFGPDKKLSLIITKRPGTQYFSFEAGGPASAVNSNGKNGQFGNINIRNNPSVHPDQIGEGRFNFCVVDAETEEPLALDFNFFFFDLDNRRDRNGKKGLQEILEVFGYDEILETDETPKTYNLVEKYDRAVVKATKVTANFDNPNDPNNLTDAQLAKSIGFSFKTTSCFRVNFLLKCSFMDEECNRGGANILFTGKANRIIPEPCIDPPTGSPTSGPTVGPTSESVAAPTSVPTDSPTEVPTLGPTASPIVARTIGPSPGPIVGPILSPTADPTNKITPEPRSDCPVYDEGTGTSVCGAGKNIVKFLGAGSQCESSGLSEDGKDPFYDIEFLTNQNIAFKVRNPFAPEGGRLFIEYSARIDGSFNNQQCVEVDGCSSESLQTSCSKHVDSAIIVLYYVYNDLICEEDKLKDVPDCCHPDEEDSGIQSLVLSYSVQCSCPAEPATKFLRSNK